MLEHPPQYTEIDYICIAADLLTEMTSGLLSLERDNRRLTLTMATAGHDLRGRLHALCGTVELLAFSKDGIARSELCQRAKVLIFQLAQELEQLALEADLDYRRAPSATHCFVIGPVLEQIKRDWEFEAMAKHLEFTVTQRECLVESDRRLLAVIMHNVVGNAVRHTNQGTVSVSSTIEGRFLALAVADTGPGISDDELQRSYRFSPRLGGLREGMGMGLCIARKTAEMLGHELNVTTRLNGGTCVRLYVPLAEHGA
jgi:two-component system, sensor histidine kinase